MKAKNLFQHSPRTPGFSIIELLIAIIIIGILVTILIPVVSNRSEDAKVARAVQDLENLANAQERLAVDTGYIGRLYILNDVPGGDGIPFQRPLNPSDIIDGLRDHGLAGELYGNGRYLFVDPMAGNLVTGVEGDQAWLRIQTNETAFGWRGPYVNWQRDNNFAFNSEIGPDGIPDDPWGNNYLLFTPLGLVDDIQGLVLSTAQFPFPSNNPGGLPSQTYDCRRFDRPTLLSLGPNGVPGDGSGPANLDGGQFGQGDDIVRKFGP